MPVELLLCMAPNPFCLKLIGLVNIYYYNSVNFFYQRGSEIAHKESNVCKTGRAIISNSRAVTSLYKIDWNLSVGTARSGRFVDGLVCI